jgi:hypothetical protein
LFDVKVYIVQKFDRDGNPGEVLAVKLTHASAHMLAKAAAPAKVIFGVADKTLLPNVGSYSSQSSK